MNMQGWKSALASAARASRAGRFARMLAAGWRTSTLALIAAGLDRCAKTARGRLVTAARWVLRSIQASFIGGVGRWARDIPRTPGTDPRLDRVVRIQSWLVVGAPLATAWLPWKTATIVMLLSFGAAAWAGAGPGRSLTRHRNILLWLAAGAGVTAMSLAFSRAPAVSLPVWLQWLTWFILAGMAFQLSHLLARPSFQIALAVTAFALGALAIAQAQAGWGDIAGWVPIRLRPQITFRVPGPFGNPNVFASALNLILWPLVFGLGGFTAIKARPAGAISAVLAGVGLVLTFSRSAWLGSVAVLIALAARRTSRRRIRPAVFLALAALGAVLATPGLLSTPALKNAAVIRVSIWSQALEAWRSRPLFGIGPGGFKDVLLPGGGMADHAHNVFLQILAETGVAGLIIAIAGTVALWHRTSRLAPKAGTAYLQPAAGIAAGLWAVLFQGLFDVPWAHPAVADLWWVWLGLFAGLSQTDTPMNNCKNHLTQSHKGTKVSKVDPQESLNLGDEKGDELA